MSQTLKFNAKHKHKIDHLPFVDAADPSAYTRHWSVPATGGAFGGLRTGRALAMLYLKHLRENPDEQRSTLVWIVRSMYMRFYIEGGEVEYERPDPSVGFTSINAQLLGFFGVLEARLRAAAPMMNDLDLHPEEALLAVANEGLLQSDETPDD